MTTHPEGSALWTGAMPRTGHVLAGLLDCGHVAAYLHSEVSTPEAPLVTTTTPFGAVARWEAMTPDEWRTAQDAMLAASTLLEMERVPHPGGGMIDAGRIVHDRCDHLEASTPPAAPAVEPRTLADIAAEQLVDPDA